MAGDKRVRVYPTEGHYLQGVKAVERLVPPDMAEVLTGGPHPAFTRDGTASKDPVLEDTDDIEAYMPPAEEPPAAPEPATPAGAPGEQVSTNG